MHTNIIRGLGVAIIIGAVAGAGCRRSSEPETTESTESPGMAERTGATLDRAADRTAEVVQETGEAAKDLTGRAIERTGEVIEGVGESMERTGADMQTQPDAAIEE